MNRQGAPQRVFSISEAGSAPSRRSNLSMAVDLATSLGFIGGLLWLSFFYHLKVDVPEVKADPFDRRTIYYSIAVPSPSVIWATGSYGRVIRSDNKGQTWTIQPAGTNETLLALVAWNDRQAVAAGDNGAVLRTEDGGATWSPLAVEMRPNGKLVLNGIVLPPSASSHAGRGLLIGEFGTILASDDQGRNWRHTHPEQDLAWHGIAIAPDGRIWVVGEFGHISVSADGGDSWTELKSPADVTLTTVVFTPRGEVVVAGLSGKTYRSGDGGATWASLPITGGESIFGGGAFETTVLAYGGDGGVYILPPGSEAWSRQVTTSPFKGFVMASAVVGDRMLFAGSGFAEVSHGVLRMFK